MSWATPPQAVRNGVLIELALPVGGVGQLNRVLLANNSPFGLVLQLGLSSFQLQPFTAAVFPCPATGGGCTALPYLVSDFPQSLPAWGDPSTLSAVWYQLTDPAPGFYPLALPAPAVLNRSAPNALETGVVGAGGGNVQLGPFADQAIWLHDLFVSTIAGAPPAGAVKVSVTDTGPPRLVYYSSVGNPHPPWSWHDLLVISPVTSGVIDITGVGANPALEVGLSYRQANG